MKKIFISEFYEINLKCSIPKVNVSKLHTYILRISFHWGNVEKTKQMEKKTSHSAQHALEHLEKKTKWKKLELCYRRDVYAK